MAINQTHAVLGSVIEEKQMQVAQLQSELERASKRIADLEAELEGARHETQADPA